MKGFKKLSKMIVSSLMIAMMLGTTVFANPIDDTALSVASFDDVDADSYDSDASDDTFVTSDSKSTHASYATGARETLQNDLEVTFLKGRNEIYTGKKITPEIVVKLDGQELVKGKDYSVSYKNNLYAAIGYIPEGATLDNNGKYLGTALAKSGKEPTVVITGKKNFTKTFNVNFNIVAKNIRSNQGVSATFVPNKDPKKIKPLLIFNGKTLKLGTDYAIDDDDDLKEGKKEGRILVKGEGNYQGYRAIAYEAGAAHKVSVKFSKPKDVVYDGNSKYKIAADSVVVTCKDKAHKDATCTIGEDYEVRALTDMTSAGTQKIMVVGKGLHKFTKTFSFSVGSCKAEGSVIVNNATIKSSYPYSPLGVTVSDGIKVTTGDGEKTLVEGVDYKITYKNNKKVGTAKYTVSFIGNYKGAKANNTQGNFEIVKNTLSDAEVYATNVIEKANGQVNSPKVYVFKDGEAVPASQYTISTTKADDGKLNVIVTGKKYYDGEAETVQVEVNKLDGKMDIANAYVPKFSAVYTGNKIEQAEAGMTVFESNQKDAKQLTADDDFEVQYLNNVNVSKKAIVIITGKGNYVGSKVVTFEIKAKNVKITK